MRRRFITIVTLTVIVALVVLFGTFLWLSNTRVVQSQNVVVSSSPLASPALLPTSSSQTSSHGGSNWADPELVGVFTFVLVIIGVLGIILMAIGPIPELIRNHKASKPLQEGASKEMEQPSQQDSRLVDSPAKPSRSPFDPAEAFLGTDIDDGQRALDVYLKQGESAIQAVAELLQKVHVHGWSYTHLEQVFYRFKMFFAEMEEKSASVLTNIVWSDNFRLGAYAAECFDLFVDRQVKVQTANSLAGNIRNRLEFPLLLPDKRDSVRNSIKALGYLGAYDWSYLIVEVLEASKEEQLFRDWALHAFARLNAKFPPQSFGSFAEVDLGRIFNGFESGRFSEKPKPVTDLEIHGIKCILRLIKERAYCDHYLKRVKYPWELSIGNALARECYIHVLATIRLPIAVYLLKLILLSDKEPLPLRMECAWALGRIPHRDSAKALREAIEVLSDNLSGPVADTTELLRNCALISLSQVAHKASDPVADLKYAFDLLPNIEAHAIEEIPELAHAVGLCEAEQYTPLLERALASSHKPQVRGQAGLALARIYGSKRLPRLLEHLENRTLNIGYCWRI